MGVSQRLGANGDRHKGVTSANWMDAETARERRKERARRNSRAEANARVELGRRYRGEYRALYLMHKAALDSADYKSLNHWTAAAQSRALTDLARTHHDEYRRRYERWVKVIANTYPPLPGDDTKPKEHLRAPMKGPKKRIDST